MTVKVVEILDVATIIASSVLLMTLDCGSRSFPFDCSVVSDIGHFFKGQISIIVG